MKLDKGDAEYLAAYFALDDKSEIARWMSTECAECNAIPDDSDSWHIRDDAGIILICCEGYHQINPRKLGIEGNWQDWNLRCANCNLMLMEESNNQFVDNTWGEWTCPISLGGNQVRHGILAHKPLPE